MSHTYKASGLFKNGHFNTLYGHFFDRPPPLPFKREKLLHPLGFSLYLDWVQQQSNKLIIFTHGLESSSNARYINSMGQQFLQQGYDVLAWNCRNCAKGEAFDPRAYYHSGLSEDLAYVIEHTLATQCYEQIVLVGFSMGGNIVLKYLGEQGEHLPSSIQRAMAISSPLDLLASSHALLQFPNQIYGRNFLKTILFKLKENPEDLIHYGLSMESIMQCKNLRDFDHLFTAAVHGFSSQDDYYKRASSAKFLPQIKVPSYLINAQDDPFLAQSCYPSSEEVGNTNIQTLYPQHGGHIGFNNPRNKGCSWLDQQALNFLL